MTPPSTDKSEGPEPVCERCNGNGWIMVTMAERRDYPIRDNYGDIDCEACPVCDPPLWKSRR